jgi:O-antigen/teichoic acid export membrane protein
LPSKQSSARALLQSTGAKLLIIVLNAATGILSARALQPVGRGELAAIILWNVLFANAFTFGIPSALTYQLRHHPDKRSQLVGSSLLIALCASILAIVLAGAGIPHWISQYSPSVIFFSRFFLWNVPLFAWSLVGRAALESEGDFHTSNLSLLLGPLLTMLWLLLLAAVHNFTPVTAAWAYVCGTLPSTALVLWRVALRFRPVLFPIASPLRLLLFYGIRSYGIDLCGTMSFYVDQVLVVHLLPPGMMGAYVVALSLSRMLNAFHTAVVMVLFPRIVSQPPAVIIDLTGRAVRITTLLTATGGLAVALLGPRLLVALYGREYRDATGVVRILVVEVILSGITLVLSQAFMAMSRPGVITVFQATGLALTVPLLLLLVPRFGVEGAATALLLSTTVRLAAVSWAFRALLDLPCPAIIAGRRDFSSMAEAVKTAWRPTLSGNS